MRKFILWLKWNYWRLQQKLKTRGAEEKKIKAKQNYDDYRIKHLKLGVFYSLFDGEELLESSIKCLRDFADYICVGFQDVSYTGQQNDTDLRPFLADLKSRGLIDDFFLFKPDFSKSPTQNERAKRNIGLKKCRLHGCKYFMNLDTDEFFIKDEFKNAAVKFLDLKAECSAAHVKCYVKEPDYLAETSDLFHSAELFSPFLFKIRLFSKCGGYSPLRMDPTRFLNGTKKFYLFSNDEINMHHMATVRKNLKKKYENSAANGDSERGKLIQNYYKRIIDWKYPEDYINLDGEKIKVTKVENIFNIDTSAWGE